MNRKWMIFKELWGQLRNAMKNERNKSLLREGWRQFRNAIVDTLSGYAAYDTTPTLVIGTLAVAVLTLMVAVLTLLLTILSIVVSIIW